MLLAEDAVHSDVELPARDESRYGDPANVEWASLHGVTGDDSSDGQAAGSGRAMVLGESTRA